MTSLAQDVGPGVRQLRRGRGVALDAGRGQAMAALRPTDTNPSPRLELP